MPTDQNQPDVQTAASTRKQALYRTIYEEQRKKVLTGEYADGERMPYERELCDQYQVDRITVRRALEMLVADGLLEKRAGLGSFVRSPQAAAPVRAPSRNILFVMAKNTNDINSNPSAYNSELFYAIEQECRQKNYSLFYAVLDQNGDLNSLLNGNSFACLLFVSYIPPAILDSCAEMGLPAICLNNRHPRLISIVPEDERGAYEAVQYLQSEGHQRIGVMLGRAEYYSTRERYRGYCAAMRDAGLAMDQQLVLQGDWTFEGARAVLLERLDQSEPAQLPTALFCLNDMMAIGAIDALRERGLRVPEDMSVMGFDNVRQSTYIAPRLSTVAIDVRLMARLAVEKIADAGSASAAGYLIMIPAVLAARQTVRKID